MLFKRISWYLGVDSGDGTCDFDAVFSSPHHTVVVFEWRLRSLAGDVQQYIVRPRADNVVSRGVPVPDSLRKSTVPLVDLDRCATEAAAMALGQLQERLGWPDMTVTCHYIGMAGANRVDINAPRFRSSTAAFNWTIRSSEFEWNEEARVRVRDLSTRSIPLPSCTLGRIHAAALAAGQAASDLFKHQVRCTYPNVLF